VRRSSVVSRRRPRLLWQPAFLLERAAQHELDLSVQAPQVIVRPSLQGVEDLRVNPEEKGFAWRQRNLSGEACRR